MTSPLAKVSHQLLLGDQDFLTRHRSHDQADRMRSIARSQRRLLALSLDEYQRQFVERDEAIANAYFSTVFTMAQIADFFGVSQRTINRAVARFERQRQQAGGGAPGG
jgi:CRP-like cAMP-binding protein